jgi:hypothetical protein
MTSPSFGLKIDLQRSSFSGPGGGPRRTGIENPISAAANTSSPTATRKAIPIPRQERKVTGQYNPPP